MNARAVFRKIYGAYGRICRRIYGRAQGTRASVLPWGLQEGGFTLLELLLAMGMLAVMLIAAAALLGGHFSRFRAENAQWENLNEARLAVEQVVRQWRQNPGVYLAWDQAAGELYADGVLIGRHITEFRREGFVGEVVLQDGTHMVLGEGEQPQPVLTAFTVKTGESPENECQVFVVLRNPSP